VALNLKAPSAFVCSRQKLKVLKGKEKIDFGSADKGGYLIKKRDNAVVTLIASGSEVMLALQSGCHLEEQGIMANVVSVPCYELFCEQDRAYIDTVIDPNTKVLAIEAANGSEWYRFADDVLGMNSFGASGKAGDLFKHFGFTIPGVIERVKALLG